ncbi:hypothetical protein [Granulicella sp. L60]|uniref:hypothetical protein n=1 Tax=Granulicella sp. L60 TaxID=1641866 RepID=UPI00131B0CE1|nr:hypothetical protein [Granulicella sp. L60]
MFSARIAALVLCLTIFYSAQRPEATGTVTGHVLCADTNLPARNAHVLLQAVVDKSQTTKAPKGEQPTQAISVFSATLLDGSFTIPNVAPGDYYIFVEKPGYLSPFASISREDLDHPKPETADLISKLLTPVTVVANRTSNAEVRILKGAAISGTIRFDDGIPDANAPIHLLNKDKTGKWVSFRTKLIAGPFEGTPTDDQGHYRISGLPAGEYLVQTSLALINIVTSEVYAENGGIANETKYSLDLYSGDSFRRRDATSIKLSEGEESTSADITIPLSKLHSVSGSLLAARTGHTVNAGNVAIVYPDDDTQLVSTKISEDDGSFRFFYVPEGQYTLKITDARDVSREEVPYPPGSFPPFHIVEKKIREYDPQQQPIIINADLSGVTAQVQPKPSAGPSPKSN